MCTAYSFIYLSFLKNSYCITEKVQRNYSKRLKNLAKYDNMEHLHSLRALSSSSMWKYHDIIFAYKVIRNPLPLKPEDFGFKLSHRSRGPLFIQETIRLERARNFARFRIPAEWNALPISSIVCISKFKQLVFNWLLLNNYDVFWSQQTCFNLLILLFMWLTFLLPTLLFEGHFKYHLWFYVVHFCYQNNFYYYY